MNSRVKTDVKNLFEFWCEVKRAHSPINRNTRVGLNAPTGIIVESFPERFREEKTIAEIPAFAFPCVFESESVQSYSFVLTTDDSKWRFGFCRHDPKTDTAVVIITYLPWHDTFLRLLTVLAELRRSNDSDFRTFLAEAYNRGVPDPGGNLKLFYNGGQNYFMFERPLQFQLPSIPENHNLNLYYNFVDPKNMIAVFAAMLAERRIIFTSQRLDRLSSCIQAANAFLYPMVWQHIFIPVLPMKLKDYLSAPMPYLIGVPVMVLETMTPDELGEVVILNCDTKTFESPFDDVRELPTDIVSQMKKQLSHSSEHIGDRVSKIFLGVLVQLISGYRDAVEFRDSGKSFNRDKFIESRPKHLRPFLAKMMDLQIFQQFIDERLDMLNTGLGFSDEFELETARYAEKMKKRRHYEFLNNVKEKTNPAVKSAVKSVKEGSRGVKTAYKDLKSKFRDITPPNSNSGGSSSSSTHFRSHLASNSQHDHIDGITSSSANNCYVINKPSVIGVHHSAPSSPIFNKRTGSGGIDVSAGGISSLTDINAGPSRTNGVRRGTGQQPPPLAMSASSAHIRSNGYASNSHGSTHLNSHLAASPTVSPASSLCSSEMNLSQELQNHPLFMPPLVDRSLKPSSSFELNHQHHYNHRISVTRTGGPPPARPPPPAAHAVLHSTSTTPSYYNHPYAVEQQEQELSQPVQSRQQHQLFTHPHATSKPPPVPRDAAQGQQVRLTSTPSKIITTNSSFDTPPEMQSPPVPPRRQCNTSHAIVAKSFSATATGAVATTSTAYAHAGVHHLERNCWQDYAERNLLQHDALRNSSSSSNSSTVSSFGSSTASFVSASSNAFYPISPPSSNELIPVPAPRHKKEKESLRSLQPHHMQISSAHNSIISIRAQQENSMNDLITLEDSNNTSFDLEDFDPLNQNARPLPLGAGGSNRSSYNKSKTLPTGAFINNSSNGANQQPSSFTNSSLGNPLHPYYKSHLTRAVQLQPPTTKPPPPPLPTSVPPPMPPPDEDFELLRKYGLDQFTLTTTATTTAHTNALVVGSNSRTNTMTTTTGGMSNWTTFD